MALLLILLYIICYSLTDFLLVPVIKPAAEGAPELALGGIV